MTPVYKQGKKVFADLERAVRNSGLFEFNKSDLIVSGFGSTIEFFSGERPDNIRGNTFHYMIVDEMAFTRSELWDEVLSATVMVKGKKVIFISTPKGKNHFHRICMQPNYDDRYAYFHFSSYDNPMIDPQELDERKRSLPDHIFRQEYMAEFIDNASGLFKGVRDVVGEAVRPIGRRLRVGMVHHVVDRHRRRGAAHGAVLHSAPPRSAARWRSPRRRFRPPRRGARCRAGPRAQQGGPGMNTDHVEYTSFTGWVDPPTDPRPALDEDIDCRVAVIGGKTGEGGAAHVLVEELDPVQAHAGDLPRGLAMDGKMLRDHFGILSLARHTDGAPEAMSVYDQKEGQGRSEQSSAAVLAESLPSLDNRLVTGDALHCNRATARAIVEKGGEYLLQIKGNQPHLEERARTLAATPGTPFLP